MLNIHGRDFGRDLDLNLLRVFAAVAETGGVTEAAKRLYLTQSAVSAARPRHRAHQPGRAVARRAGRAPRPAGRGGAGAGVVRSGDRRTNAAPRPLRLGRAVGLATPPARARARGPAHPDR